MPRSNKVLKERLSRYREIRLSVTGRTSGKTISIPVWFVVEGDTLFLLPVGGSDTQWYKNVLHDPQIRISARSEGGEFQRDADHRLDSGQGGSGEVPREVRGRGRETILFKIRCRGQRASVGTRPFLRSDWLVR